jgi:hypothetical protein
MPAVQEPMAMPTLGAAPLRPEARVGAEPAKRRAQCAERRVRGEGTGDL